MTPEQRYTLALEEAHTHLRRLAAAFRLLDQAVGLPLDGAKVERVLQDDVHVSFLDQVAYRFSKLQDVMGKVLRLWMLVQGESVDPLTMLDVLALAERYGLGIDPERWLEMRDLRNLIVHEYDNTPAKIAEAANRIREEMDMLAGLLDRLEARRKRKARW